MLTLLASPVQGTPLVPFTGEQTGYAVWTPFSPSGNQWAGDLEIRDLYVIGQGEFPGCAMSLTSTLDTVVENFGSAGCDVGVRCSPGPLNCYPLRFKGIYCEFPKDCGVHMQMTTATIEGLEVKYPQRSTARLFQGSGLHVTDTFVAPGSGAECGGRCLLRG